MTYAGTIYSDYTAFDDVCQSVALPDEYWNITDGHYLLRLLPPTTETIQAKQESRLVPRFLAAITAENDSEDGFKLFGQPYWLQDAEQHQCACGAPMQLLLQIPDGQGFTMAEGADEQPNSFSRTEFCIFLGISSTYWHAPSSVIHMLSGPCCRTKFQVLNESLVRGSRFINSYVLRIHRNTTVCRDVRLKEVPWPSDC